MGYFYGSVPTLLGINEATQLHHAVYASFEVTADGEGKSFDIPLNDVAIRDLQDAVDNGGQFFSIGFANVILDATGYIRLGSPELRISTP